VGLRYFAAAGSAVPFDAMTEYLVELYVSKTNCAAIPAGWNRLRDAAAELTGEGRPVRIVRSIFVPDDETCFLLVETGAVATVRETARRAGLACERIVEATVDLSENDTSRRNR
jgi:hypothetical protein